jgi:hypothetical protein
MEDCEREVKLRKLDVGGRKKSRRIRTLVCVLILRRWRRPVDAAFLRAALLRYGVQLMLAMPAPCGTPQQISWMLSPPLGVATFGYANVVPGWNVTPTPG